MDILITGPVKGDKAAASREGGPGAASTPAGIISAASVFNGIFQNQLGALPGRQAGGNLPPAAGAVSPSVPAGADGLEESTEESLAFPLLFLPGGVEPAAPSPLAPPVPSGSPAAPAAVAFFSLTSETDPEGAPVPLDIPGTTLPGTEPLSGSVPFKLPQTADTLVADLHAEPAAADGKPLPPDGKSLPPAPAASAIRLEAQLTDKLELQAAFEGNRTPSPKPEALQVPLDQGALKALASLSGAESGGAQPGQSGLAHSGAGTAAARTGTAHAAASFALHTPAGSEGWNQEIGARIRWMQRMDMPSAELRLNPAELGSVEVRIVTEDDRTTVSFVASSTAAKEMIEQSLPKLREMLAGQGLQLENSEVSQQAGGGRGRDPKTSSGAAALPESGALNQAGEADTDSGAPAERLLNLVDHYV